MFKRVVSLLTKELILYCYLQSSGVTVNNINISVENVIAANGIMHIINTAIMPPSADLVVGDRSVRSNFFYSSVSVKVGSLTG